MENNPLRYADPLGDTIIIRYTDITAHKTEVAYSKGAVSPRKGDIVVLDNVSEYISNVIGDLNTIKASNDNELNKGLTTLENSEQIHVNEMPDPGRKNGNIPNSSSDDRNGIPTGTTTKYNPEDYRTARGELRKPVIGLGHELLGYGYDSDQGKTNYRSTTNGISMHEVSAVNVENRVRASVGAPKKTTYGGNPIPANLLDDTHNKKKK